jgi:hypothetical protein
VTKKTSLFARSAAGAHDQVIAEVHPPSQQPKPRRQPGALRGQIHIAPDFDELPDDILAAMEE